MFFGERYSKCDKDEETGFEAEVSFAEDKNPLEIWNEEERKIWEGDVSEHPSSFNSTETDVSAGALQPAHLKPLDENQIKQFQEETQSVSISDS